MAINWNNKNRTLEYLELSSNVVLWGIVIVSIIFMLYGSPDPEQVKKFFNAGILYVFVLPIVALIFIVGKVREIVIGNDIQLKKKSMVYYLYSFDPDKGILPKIKIGNFQPFKFMYSLGDSIVVYITFFSLMGLLGMVTQNFASTPMSVVTGLNDIKLAILVAEPSALTETLFFVVLTALILGVLKRYQLNHNKKDWWFYIMALVIGSTTIGILGFTIHRTVYTELSSLSITFLFWAIGTIFMILSGTYLVFWIMHFMNNFYSYLSKSTVFTHNDLILLTIATLIVLNGIYFGIKLAIRNRKKIKEKAMASVGAT